MTASSWNKILLNGSAEPGSVVHVSDNGSVIGTATANSSGVWSLATSVGHGIQSFTEQSTDAAGQTVASPGEALYSRSGSANLVGGSGNDVLVGQNHDTLTGGAGSDTFVFNKGFGLETVADFSPSNDVIAVNHTVFSSFANLMQHATQSGTSTLITYDKSNVITLLHTNLSSLTSSDFVFI